MAVARVNHKDLWGRILSGVARRLLLIHEAEIVHQWLSYDALVIVGQGAPILHLVTRYLSEFFKKSSKSSQPDLGFAKCQGSSPRADGVTTRFGQPKFRNLIVLVVGCSSSDFKAIHHRFARETATTSLDFVHILPEVSAEERMHSYAAGGVFFASTRTLVLDLLTHHLPGAAVDCVVLFNAERLSSRSNEMFMVRLLRTCNPKVRIKAISNNPKGFMKGYNVVEKTLRILGHNNIRIYPRFSSSMRAGLHPGSPVESPNVEEIILNLSSGQRAILNNLVKLSEAALKGLSYYSQSHDLADEEGKSCFFRFAEFQLRERLEIRWNDLPANAKRLVGDMAVFRNLMVLLTELDAVWFFRSVRSLKLRIMDSTGLTSSWIHSCDGDELYLEAKDRVYRIQKPSGVPGTEQGDESKKSPRSPFLQRILEPHQKWVALRSIFEEEVCVCEGGTVTASRVEAEESQTCYPIEAHICDMGHATTTAGGSSPVNLMLELMDKQWEDRPDFRILVIVATPAEKSAMSEALLFSAEKKMDYVFKQFLNAAGEITAREHRNTQNSKSMKSRKQDVENQRATMSTEKDSVGYDHLEILLLETETRNINSSLVSELIDCDDSTYNERLFNEITELRSPFKPVVKFLATEVEATDALESLILDFLPHLIVLTQPNLDWIRQVEAAYARLYWAEKFFLGVLEADESNYHTATVAGPRKSEETSAEQVHVRKKRRISHTTEADYVEVSDDEKGSEQSSEAETQALCSTERRSLERSEVLGSLGYSEDILESLKCRTYVSGRYVKVCMMRFADCPEEENFLHSVKLESEAWDSLIQQQDTLVNFSEKSLQGIQNMTEEDTLRWALASESHLGISLEHGSSRRAGGGTAAARNALERRATEKIKERMNANIEAGLSLLPTKPARDMTVEELLTMIRPTIIVDVREFRASLPFQLWHAGISLTPLTLPTGDYILSRDVAVERKSLPDLVQSIRVNKLYRQCADLSRVYSRPTLLIEFDNSARGFHRMWNTMAEDSLLLPSLTHPVRASEAKPIIPGSTLFNATQFAHSGFYIGVDPASKDLMVKLVNLILQLPKLKLIWSPDCAFTTRVFQLLKTGREEPSVYAAIAAREKLFPEETTTASVTAGPAGGREVARNPAECSNSTALDFLRCLPGVTDQALVRIVSKTSTVRQLFSMEQGELIEVMGQKEALEFHAFICRDLFKSP